jgi:hypothetical protein
VGETALDCIACCKHVRQVAAVHLDLTSAIRLFLNCTASLSGVFFNRAVTLLSSAEPFFCYGHLTLAAFVFGFSLLKPAQHFLWQPFAGDIK